ncbi:MAG: hypothetical protein HQK99_10965 [Nitrospirae bacterium]|nr:hypothetical protein [Nitrospirota bacterium]
MDIDLSQTEADALIAMHKYRVNEDKHKYPYAGHSLRIPLVSGDKHEKFMLTIRRGRIDLINSTFQNLERHNVVLIRVDIGGPTHRNPDAAEVQCPHIHIYKEGFGDKWAFPLPPDRFTNPDNQWQTLREFMQFCNVVNPPNIIGRLII